MTSKARRIYSFTLLLAFLCPNALSTEGCAGAIGFNLNTAIYSNPNDTLMLWEKFGGEGFYGSQRHLLLSYRTSYAINKALEEASSRGISLVSGSLSDSRNRAGNLWFNSLSEIETVAIARFHETDHPNFVGLTTL